MPEILVLDETTIDKIAAGEVVERPSSVVKELVENAIDSGATSVTVEIKDGGTTFLRVTDNGCGIEKAQVKIAFLRHATSKIRSVEDLLHIGSLGFRGEALSSICAVSQVELITKVVDDITGAHYIIEGAKEKSLEEIGAPTGTTFLIRNLFYNVPARRKFLKSNATEGSYISELIEHMALSKPELSITYINQNQTKLQTSGTGDLKEVIYKIYGREVTSQLIPIYGRMDTIEISGYLAEPTVVRSNRNYETYFVNGRYVKSNIISKAIEEAYKPYLMQHKYPFVVLSLNLPSEMLDVNVHPTKMELRFSDNEKVFEFIKESISSSLHQKEHIPEMKLVEKETIKVIEKRSEKTPEPFEVNRIQRENALLNETPLIKETSILKESSILKEAPVYQFETESSCKKESSALQLNLFDEKILTKKARDEYEIIGQIFDTYWIIGYKEKVLFVDQHAAHEKVLYERFKKLLEKKEMISQQLNPPLVISVSGKEEEVIKNFMDNFETLGFEISEFGGNEYTIGAIPADLYGLNAKELFLELLDDLSDGLIRTKNTDMINDKIAVMACKAAVKGNMRIGKEEIGTLLDELLKLENPYACPHGRPTIISMTKYEMEKKFKRIV
ncbi:MAG: DNA mismatch repair endonuclease MutL [Lachnospiraceae bacterium]|nr:DNA mismatch repair endonuclease MutL [Lachnospiraceae bacterium]